MKQVAFVLVKSILIVLLISMYAENIKSEVLFKDTFNYTWNPTSDAGKIYPCKKSIGGSCTSLNDYPVSKYPLGSRTNANSWNGFRQSSVDIAIEPNVGVKSSGALRITYPKGEGVSGEGSLVKWLGGEYDEIYVQWKFKLDDDGEDAWRWGDGTSDSWSFIKLARVYQGVDLNSVKEVPSDPGQYYVHVKNYPNYIIPEIGNYSSEDTRPIVPVVLPVTQNNQFVYDSGSTLWRVNYKYHYPAFQQSSAFAPADGTTDHVLGPIYTKDESTSLAGYHKNKQDWHRFEMHFKTRTLSSNKNATEATYVDEWKVTVVGDKTSTFLPGTLVLCNNTSQYNGINAPVIMEVDSSIYSGGVTTLNFEKQPSAEGPYLTSSITTVETLTETSPGVMEYWIDGKSVGNHTHPDVGNQLANNNIGGGWSYIILADNLDMVRGSNITMYIDDFVISTKYIGVVPIIDGMDD